MVWTRRHEIRYLGGDQEIRSVLTRGDGTVIDRTDLEYRIVDLRRSEDDAERVLVAFTAATLDATTTTTTSVAGTGAEPGALEVTSVAGFEPRRRYLVSGAGRSEIVQIDGVDAGAGRLQLVGELGATYPVGSTVSGLEVAGMFPAAAADDEQDFESGSAGPFAIDWKPADGKHWREHIYLIRHGSMAYVDEAWLRLADPEVVSKVGRSDGLVQAIDYATQYYEATLNARCIDPRTIGAASSATMAVGHLALWRLWRTVNTEHGREMREQYHDEARRWMKQIFVGVSPVDATEEKPASDTRAFKSPRPSLRLTL